MLQRKYTPKKLLEREFIRSRDNYSKIISKHFQNFLIFIILKEINVRHFSDLHQTGYATGVPRHQKEAVEVGFGALF